MTHLNDERRTYSGICHFDLTVVSLFVPLGPSELPETSCTIAVRLVDVDCTSRVQLGCNGEGDARKFDVNFEGWKGGYATRRKDGPEEGFSESNHEGGYTTKGDTISVSSERVEWMSQQDWTRGRYVASTEGSRSKRRKTYLTNHRC